MPELSHVELAAKVLRYTGPNRDQVRGQAANELLARLEAAERERDEAQAAWNNFEQTAHTEHRRRLVAEKRLADLERFVVGFAGRDALTQFETREKA